MIRIRVNGIPAPQGSKRHVGNGRMIEMSKAVGPWRNAVRAETQHRLEAMLFAGEDYSTLRPVSVTAVFVLPRPKSHYCTGRNVHLLRDAAPPRPAGRPDLDKLLRSTLDGLTMGGAFADDSQVVDVAGSKVWASEGQAPGVIIEIEEAK